MVGRCLGSEFAGMEDTVALFVASMAILATSGGAHLLMTTNTAQVIGTFQPGLIFVIKRRMLVPLFYQSLRGKRLGQVASLATDNRLGAAVFVATGTIGIIDLSTGGVVVAEPTIFECIDVSSVVEFDSGVILLN